MILGIRGIEESSIYQDIFAKGEAEGQMQGAVEEARNTLLRQGRKKLGPPGEAVQARIASLGDLDRLNDRILDVSSWDELLPLSAPSE